MPTQIKNVNFYQGSEWALLVRKKNRTENQTTNKRKHNTNQKMPTHQILRLHCIRHWKQPLHFLDFNFDLATINSFTSFMFQNIKLLQRFYELRALQVPQQLWKVSVRTVCEWVRYPLNRFRSMSLPSKIKWRNALQQDTKEHYMKSSQSHCYTSELPAQQLCC